MNLASILHFPSLCWLSASTVLVKSLHGSILHFPSLCWLSASTVLVKSLHESGQHPFLLFLILVIILHYVGINIAIC
jgi:hypothetical protein